MPTHQRKIIIALSATLFTTLFTLSGPVLADKMLAINSGCFGCHQIDKKTVGPAIQDIAKKHKSSDLEQLVQIVKTGKSGDQLTWGTTPMPPNGAPEENIRKVIQWMLSH